MLAVAVVDLLADFALFRDPWLTALASAVVLAWLGLPMVARDQIFAGAAVAEAAVLGVVVGMVNGQDAGVSLALGTAFAVAANALCARAFADPHRSGEATAGTIFLIGISLSVLLLTHDPHGTHRMQGMLLSGTLIGADAVDACLAGGAVVFVGVVLALRRDTILLLVADPAHADAVGVRTRTWSHAIGLVTGLCIAHSVRTAGLPFTLGMLVLPALAAGHLVPTLRATVVVAPLLAALAAGIGIVVSHGHDLPPGQTIVAVAAALTLLAAYARPFVK
jgi:ABC-type Mn2+/Zn2+ transport system permease subunit